MSDNELLVAVAREEVVVEITKQKAAGKPMTEDEMASKFADIYLELCQMTPDALWLRAHEALHVKFGNIPRQQYTSGEQDAEINAKLQASFPAIEKGNRDE
jgi:hypothetical protein